MCLKQNLCHDSGGPLPVSAACQRQPLSGRSMSLTLASTVSIAEHPEISAHQAVALGLASCVGAASLPAGWPSRGGLQSPVLAAQEVWDHRPRLAGAAVAAVVRPASLARLRKAPLELVTDHTWQRRLCGCAGHPPGAACRYPAAAAALAGCPQSPQCPSPAVQSSSYSRLAGCCDTGF